MLWSDDREKSRAESQKRMIDFDMHQNIDSDTVGMDYSRFWSPAVVSSLVKRIRNSE